MAQGRFEGSRLAYLLAKTGYFHDAHRAVDDCLALLEILAAPLPKSQKSALAALLHQARRKTVRVWAEYAPFELKDELKKRRYRWSDGIDGRPRAWYVDVDEEDEGKEIEYLRGRASHGGGDCVDKILKSEVRAVQTRRSASNLRVVAANVAVGAEQGAA